MEKNLKRKVVYWDLYSVRENVVVPYPTNESTTMSHSILLFATVIEVGRLINHQSFPNAQFISVAR